MSTPPTATQLAKMKSQAKERAKNTDASYNATLEIVAREHGFDSWFAAMQLHKTAAPAAADEIELMIDPVLPPNFDNTPNEDRSDDELAQWWMKPFAHVLPDGRYEVRCLDGGAWDRATWYGTADDLQAARVLASTKLAKWRSYMDRPTLTIDEGSVSLTVDSLQPTLPRAVLASFDNQALAMEWMKAWDLLLATEPEVAQAQLAQARAQVQAEYRPTEQEMAEQYAILSRLALLEEDGRRSEAPDPLRADIQACVDKGLVLAVKVESDALRVLRSPVWKLTLSPTGRELLTLFEEHLEATGQK